MSNRTSVLLALVGLSACNPSGAEQRLTDTYEALSQRLGTHIDTTNGMDDAGSIHDETDAYCADMSGDADDMEAACDDMMGRGGMTGGGGGMDDDRRARLQSALDDVMGEVDGHCARMDDLDEVGAMHDECGDHDAEMGGLLDVLGEEVPGSDE